MNNKFITNIEKSLFSTKKKIYTYIAKNPGLHFRELHRELKIGRGNLAHHLKQLEKINLIVIEKEKGFKRIYPLHLTEKERNLIGLLRQRNFKNIIIILLKKKEITHKELCIILDLSPSTTSWYLSNLLHKKLINIQVRGRNKYFSIISKKDILKVLISYNKSFIDILVDEFIDEWDI
jgi:predicted transcriptional regulator